MESANFHQQQHQDHQPVLDSSSYGLSWSQNPILNTINNNNNATNNPIENFMTHELQRLSRTTKHEFSNSSESYPTFSEMINSSPTSSVEDLHLNPSSRYNNNQDLFVRTFSNGCQIKGGQLIDQIPDDINPNNQYQSCSSDRMSSRGTFSQIFPTINISNLNQSSAATISSNSFDMNLPRFNGNFGHPSSFNPNYHQISLSYGLDQMNQRHRRPVICNSKIPAALNSTRTSCTETKRSASNCIDTKATQATTKKSKLEPRASCTPFKVRKEKLGDRIAALQQLVAPFGKTDTASVLMEAIGYIKFLQNQVETLSVPYMKSTNKTNNVPTGGVPVDDGYKEAKRDLRSRGLCLVPLSCLSYVTDGGGGIWSGP